MKERLTREKHTLLFKFAWRESESRMSCLTLCDPMNYTVHGILQDRVLEWVTFLSLLQGIFSTQGSNTKSPTLHVNSLPAEPPGKPKNTGVDSLSLLHWIFWTQELNWGLLRCRTLPAELPGRPIFFPTQQLKNKNRALIWWSSG